MSLNSLLNMTVDIYRAGAGVGIQTGYSLLNEGVPTMIQPITGEMFSKTGMNYDKAYNALFPMGTDIIVSDRVIDNHGTTYQVTGFYNRPYGSGAVQHITAMLTEELGASVVGG